MTQIFSRLPGSTGIRRALCAGMCLALLISLSQIAECSVVPILHASTRPVSDQVIVKVRDGYLTTGNRLSVSVPDRSRQVAAWAAAAGADGARLLWDAPVLGSRTAVIDDHPGRRTFVLTPRTGTSPEELAERLGHEVWVEYAEVDRLYDLHQAPNDSLYPRQWHLENTGQSYWSVFGVAGIGNDSLGERAGIPGADVRFRAVFDHPGPKTSIPVGIIDTGIDTGHEDLTDRMFINSGEIPDNGIDDDHNGFIDDIYGWDFAGDVGATPGEIIEDNDVSDSIGHGTHVAGTVAATANNGIGIAGVADSARVFACKIFPNSFFSVSSKAIYYAVARGARVINMSWGGGFPSNAVHDALIYAFDRDVVLIASMGNSGRDEVFYPSGYPETIGIGASNATDHLESFSTYNDHVELVAPGRDVLSLRATGTDMFAPGGEPEVHIIKDRYYLASGTSMAAPHATGAAAALLSIAPGLSSERVRDILKSTADDIIDPYGNGASLPGYDRFTGWGRIDLQSALLQLPGVFVAIDAPAAQEWVGGTVDVIGHASGAAFAGYTVSYAPGHMPDSSDWIVLTSSVAPVSGGTLAQWNTVGLEGAYTLRVDAGNDAVVDVRLNVVQASTAAITSPTNGDTAQLVVTIMGTAAAPDFNRFYLEAQGPLPSANISPIGEFTHRVWEDTLANWALDQLSNGKYWLRLVTETDGGSVRDSVLVTVDDIFHENWPVTLPAHAHFAVAALDLDGYFDPSVGSFTKEIICPTNRGLWVLRSDGTSYPEWPRDTLSNYRTPPAFADLDNDGRSEIIIATPDAMHVYAFIGEEYQGWPQPFDGASHLYGVSLPTVGNIDPAFDAGLEIVAIDKGGTINVWRENGTSYTTFPSGGGFGSIPIARSSSNSLPQARICDLERDGRPELIAYGDEIHVFDGHSGAPRGLNGTSMIVSHNSIHGMVIGDFNNDAVRDIAYVATEVQGGPFFLSIVSVYRVKDDSTGEFRDTVVTLPGWPQTIPPTADKFLLYAMSGGDIDGDRIPELFVAPYSLGEGALYAFHANGSPVASDSSSGLFAMLPGSASAVTLIDVDNDTDPEIVFRVGELLFGPDQVFALEADGSLVNGYPIMFGSGSSTTASAPILADVNGDGLSDMVTVQSTGTSIALWDLATPVSARGQVWERFQGDLWNSGVALTPLYDAVYLARLIDYVLINGRDFPPYEPTDLNCDGFPDAVDIATLIDYFYMGGPHPCVP